MMFNSKEEFNEWALNLLEKYGIQQPVAEHDPVDLGPEVTVYFNKDYVRGTK